ncbi:MAG: hypothetical protein OWU32_02455 [Firmicutes bacterium]|nr:hypothetical protein [Bacillota bacterium]
MASMISRTAKWLVPVTAGVLLMGTAAFADMQGQMMMGGKLFGNIPNVTVRGVAAGGAPWIVDGSYKLTSTDISASGQWLIIPKTGYLANGKPIPKAVAGTTAGVTQLVAEITFANAAPIVTKPFALNAKGDFKMDQMIMMPKGAADPVVLIGPSDGKGGEKVWFASSNFLMDYGQAMMGKGSMMNGSSSGKSGSNW